MHPLKNMHSIKEYSSKEELDLLTKSFAKNLLQRGFSQGDLIIAATTILDQAIRSEEIERPKKIKRDHLKVLP